MFNKYKLIGIIASHLDLWKACAMYVNIVINILIVFSYNDFGDNNNPKRFDEPRFLSD